MSILRKTVLTTAIIGAGLASTTGAAFAGDCPSHGHASHEKTQSAGQGDGCLNATEAENSNGAERVTRGDVTGGAQSIGQSNVCGNLSNNEILSNNNIAILGGTVRNGDSVEQTTNTSTAESTSIFKSILG